MNSSLNKEIHLTLFQNVWIKRALQLAVFVCIFLIELPLHIKLVFNFLSLRHGFDLVGIYIGFIVSFLTNISISLLITTFLFTPTRAVFRLFIKGVVILGVVLTPFLMMYFAHR